MVAIISEMSEIPSTGLVVIDFFATWCGPCKKIAPFYDELAKVYPNVTFLKVDVDESGEIVERFNVNAMPTFVFLKDSQIVKVIEGADVKGIGAVLETWV
jgi:thioredoxin 1